MYVGPTHSQLSTQSRKTRRLRLCGRRGLRLLLPGRLMASFETVAKCLKTEQKRVRVFFELLWVVPSFGKGKSPKVYGLLWILEVFVWRGVLLRGFLASHGLHIEL